MDRKWWTLIAVCVGTFMLLLDVTIVNVALPSIQTSLHASFSDVQWVIDAYSLTLAAFLLTTGSFADLWGRRLIFVIGLVVFTASSLASGLAQSPLWLNLARGAQGVGASAMFSTSLALLGSSFQGRERGVAFGVWGAITGLAVAIGPVIGGGLTTGLSWRWIFLVNVPIGLAAMVICLLRVPESKMARARKPDPIGVVTFSGALAALIYALIKGDDKGWTSPEIVGCLVAAVVLLIAFLIAERLQKDRAMFDLSLFRKPTFTGGAVAAFALSGGLFALFLYMTLYLQDVLRFSALQTGLRFLVLSGGILLTSTLAGRLTAVVPIRFLIAPGLIMVGVGLFLMRGITAETGWTHLVPGFIVAGAGTGFINPPLASTAIGVVRPERAGMASGINSTFRQVGIATGIAGLGAIFTHEVRTTIEGMLHGSSQISSAQAHGLASSVASGGGATAGLQSVPLAARGTAIHALKAGFAAGLNEVFLVGAILSLVAAALTFVLIRSKDFEVGAARTVSKPGDPVPGAAMPLAEPPAGTDQPSSADGGPGTAVSGSTDPAAPAAAEPAPGVSAVAAPATGGGGAEVSGAGTQAAVEPDRSGNLGEAAGPPAGTDEPGNGSKPQVKDETGAVGSSAAEPAAALATGAGPATTTLQQRMAGYGYNRRPPVPPPPPPPPLASHGAQSLQSPYGSEVPGAPSRAEARSVAAAPAAASGPAGPAGPAGPDAASGPGGPAAPDAGAAGPDGSRSPYGSGFSGSLDRERRGAVVEEASPPPAPPFSPIQPGVPPPPTAQPEPPPPPAAAPEPPQSEAPPSEAPQPEPPQSEAPEPEVPELQTAQLETPQPEIEHPEVPEPQMEEPWGPQSFEPPGPQASWQPPASFAQAAPEPPHGQEPGSDLPNGQDVSVSSDAPAGGAPNTRDVRLVAAAVQNAEEAALAYAREIGEARRHLAVAIQHLDRAEEARALLNQYATGFTAPGPNGGPAGQDADAQARAQSGFAGTAPPTPDRSDRPPAGPMSMPSPGIAVAGETPAYDPTATPNPADAPPPPPRPGGWGSGGGGTP